MSEPKTVMARDDPRLKEAMIGALRLREATRYKPWYNIIIMVLSGEESYSDETILSRGIPCVFLTTDPNICRNLKNIRRFDHEPLKHLSKEDQVDMWRVLTSKYESVPSFVFGGNEEYAKTHTGDAFFAWKL